MQRRLLRRQAGNMEAEKLSQIIQELRYLKANYLLNAVERGAIAVILDCIEDQIIKLEKMKT